MAEVYRGDPATVVAWPLPARGWLWLDFGLRARHWLYGQNTPSEGIETHGSPWRILEARIADRCVVPAHHCSDGVCCGRVGAMAALCAAQHSRARRCGVVAGRAWDEDSKTMRNRAEGRYGDRSESWIPNRVPLPARDR